MNRYLRIIAGSSSLALATLLAAGCGHGKEHAAAPVPTLAVAAVKTQVVEKKSRTMTEEVVGTVRAKLHATLESKLNGRVAQMPVVLGDSVQKGQLIAEVDALEVAARLEQAEAALDQAEHDWERISTLYGQQGATRAEYDTARARQRGAAGAVAEAKAMMAYAKIVAPFDGVVTRKWADVGDLAVPGKPLVDLEDPSGLQVEADVPEAVAAHVQPRASLSVRTDGTNGDIVAVVSEMAPALDSASRTLRVKLDPPQTSGLKSGQFVRLAVPIGDRTSVRVPISAVVQRGQLEIVFSVSGQRARMHLVKTGKRVDDEVEILSGLDAGNTVVTSGGEQLSDGQPVEAK